MIKKKQVNIFFIFGVSTYTCCLIDEAMQNLDSYFPTAIASIQGVVQCSTFFIFLLISAPIMGCFPLNGSLPSLGPAPLLSSPVCEMQTSGMVSACMCHASGCNYDGHRLKSKKQVPRIPRDAESREPKNFIFPFANSSTAGMSGSRDGRQRRLKCFSCGSLFNRDSPHCAEFDPSNGEQVMTCNEGEACMLYTWKKSRTEIG